MTPSRIFAGLREGLLWLAAVLGGIVLLSVVLGFVFGLSLVLFKSASMSPSIPAGSVALVRAIPAAEIRVGDVVTVDRPGARPITHRVTSIEPLSATEVSLTLRGDANASDDPEPYRVTSVRRVVASVEHLAYPIAWLSQPAVVGSLAVAAAALVTWAFWPSAAPPKNH